MIKIGNKCWDVRLEFKLQDFWIGVFWKNRSFDGDIWICLLPCVPIHVSWYVVSEPFFSHQRTDWPDGLWPKAVEPEYLQELKKIPYEERMKMIMGDPSVDLPEYCVCRVPQRPLIDGVWCRECQGRVEEVTVRDLSNYAHGYVEETPFEGRVIGRSDGGEPVMIWIQSIKTGKQYELYEWQFENVTDGEP